jgi:hypothetical protein
VSKPPYGLPNISHSIRANHAWQLRDAAYFNGLFFPATRAIKFPNLERDIAAQNDEFLLNTRTIRNWAGWAYPPFDLGSQCELRWQCAPVRRYNNGILDH